MSLGFPRLGSPGAGTARRATPRRVSEGGLLNYLPGGVYINGAKSRDPGNTGDVDTLRAGTLMGMITATGFYAPTVLGVVASAYTSGGTTLTVSAAQAVEIARRVGTSGTATLKAIGPPTAAGTVATTSITYSAINQSTGDITVTSLGVDKIAGTLITAADGSQAPLSFIPDGFGVKVTDPDGSSIAQRQWPDVPIAGRLLLANLLPAITDTSLKAWLIAALNGAAGGQFIFTDYLYHI